MGLNIILFIKKPLSFFSSMVSRTLELWEQGNDVVMSKASEEDITRNFL